MRLLPTRLKMRRQSVSARELSHSAPPILTISTAAGRYNPKAGGRVLMSSESRTTASPAIIVGRYRVVTLIAHGGMGSLYLARDPALDRTIAIKLLQKGFDDEAARERFAREARAAGRLRHPNIVTVFDVGEHDNRPFIAMEYVPGETLDQLIRRRTPLSIANRLLILED